MNKECYLCKHNIQTVDYKDSRFLRRFMTPQAKIANRRRTGTCALHQRKVARAVKRARVMGLVPFTTRTIR